MWDDHEADTELIGRGAFARVFKAIRRADQEPVAIKVIGRDTKAFNQQRRGESSSCRGSWGLETKQQLTQMHSMSSSSGSSEGPMEAVWMVYIA